LFRPSGKTSYLNGVDNEMLRLELPEGLLERIARRAAEVVLARLAERDGWQQESPWMTIAEAAEYLRCNRQRIYELRSARRLTPHVENGRALCARDEVEALVVVGGAKAASRVGRRAA
jgi:excisionase family DNA binding protein